MKTQNRERICAVLFLLPSALLLLIFVLWPMLYSGVMSFFNWDPLKGASFIGLKNFVKLMGDKLWWTSLANTLFYIVLNVPLIILLALAMSELVVALAKRSMFLSKLFKSVYFLPAVLSLVATSIAWRYLLNTNTGSINGILVTLGLDPVGWFTNSKLAMLSIVIITTWRWAGYYMVMIVAGRLSISEEYYEAANIDGANGWRKFTGISLPLISPVLYVIALMSVIGSFQEFDLFYMITSGGPGTATYVTGLYLYEAAFTSRKMGYACAMAVVLFVIVFALTMLQSKTADKLGG